MKQKTSKREKYGRLKTNIVDVKEQKNLSFRQNYQRECQLVYERINTKRMRRGDRDNKNNC